MPGTTSWWRRLRPEYPEVIDKSVYLRGMKLRLMVFPVLAVLNVLLSFMGVVSPEVDHDLYITFLAWNLPAHGAIIAINLFGLLRRPTIATCRWLAVASLVCESFTAATGLWTTGAQTSTINVLWFVLLIGLYRIYFDAALGMLACAVAIFMYAGVVVLEIAGVIRTGQLFEMPTFSVSVMTGGILWHSAGFIVTLIIANIVARRNYELREAKRHLARLQPTERRGRLADAIIDDKYEVIRIIGRGGMGEVYLARQRTDGAHVAIKVMHPFHSDDPSMLDRFQREAKVAEQVAPGHVPRVFDVGTTSEGQHYIVMEYLHGESLADFIKREAPVEPERAADLVAKIATAIDAVHETGAVHRDIKPSNVHLTLERNDYRVRLLDFGISKFQDEAAALTQTVHVMGSPGYMSPEAARGDSRSLGPPADTFALGVIAYQLLTDQLPFPASDVALFAFEVMHVTPRRATDFADLHSDVDAVLTLALAKEPAERYPRAADLTRDLAAAVRGNLSPDKRARAEEYRSPPKATGKTLTDHSPR